MRPMLIRIDDHEYENINNIAKGMNLTLSDYLIKCHVAYCDTHKLDVNNATKRKITRAEQHNFRYDSYFISNAYEAIHRMVMKQIKCFGAWDHELIKAVAAGFLAEYELLPDTSKKFLKKQRDEFSRVLDETKFEMWFGCDTTGRDIQRFEKRRLEVKK